MIYLFSCLFPSFKLFDKGDNYLNLIIFLEIELMRTNIYVSILVEFCSECCKCYRSRFFDLAKKSYLFLKLQTICVRKI